MRKTIKAINFDIKQDLLDIYYPKSNSNAYYDIKKFMLNNGFEHIQGSGYVSKNKLDVDNIYDILQNLKNEYPWSIVCIEKIEVTEKVTTIQNEKYNEDRLIITEILNKCIANKYASTQELVSNMLLYRDLTGEVPDLSNLSYLYIAEKNEALKDIILEIKTECESQDIEKQVEKYITQSLDEDIEKDTELDEDLEI